MCACLVFMGVALGVHLASCRGTVVVAKPIGPPCFGGICVMHGGGALGRPGGPVSVCAIGRLMSLVLVTTW